MTKREFLAMEEWGPGEIDGLRLGSPCAGEADERQREPDEHGHRGRHEHPGDHRIAGPARRRGPGVGDGEKARGPPAQARE